MRAHAWRTGPIGVPLDAAHHDAPAAVIAYNTPVVRSQIRGQITQMAFTEGQSVKAGDLLAQIDPPPYRTQLDQVIATRDRDQAQLANALGNLARREMVRISNSPHQAIARRS
jgi:multidrug efflux pump subunit AcrA (membrane-fusion protein)